MKTATQHLIAYAAYHRDKRNIATHFVGIPMIVVAVAMLLAAAHPYAAYVTLVAASIWYLVKDVRLGLAMLGFNGAALWLGLQGSLWVGVGLFVAGWVLQFIGHWFEGKKPAFVDDLVGLLVGPMFVVAEAGFMIGLRRPLQADIEAKTGPTRINEKRGAAPSAAP